MKPNTASFLHAAAGALVVSWALPPMARAANEPTINMVVRAAGESDASHLKSLLAVGGPVNGSGAHDETPLQSAAANGNSENVTLLLARGAALNDPASRGITALGWAARGGHDDVVRILLDAGADVDGGLAPNRTAIVLAAARGNLASVDLLFARGSKAAEIPELGAALLLALVDANDVSVSSTVASRLATLVATSPRVSHAAAEAIASCNPEASRAIRIGLGAALDSPGFDQALLFAAADHGRLDLATTAVEHGADVSARNDSDATPLTLAIAGGHSAVVAFLFDHGADPQALGIDAATLPPSLADAYEERRAALLLERIGALDARDSRGETLLFRAAQRGDAARVGELLRKGAKPDVVAMRRTGGDGWTPLMTAAAEGHLAVAQRLLAAGASVDQRNGKGRTALAFAAWYGRAAVVAVLLGAGADADAIDREGDTALQAAIAQGDSATIEVLKAHASGASTDDESAPGSR